MTPEQHEMAVFLVGPWLIGTISDIFLQGLLCAQFVHYWTSYHNDRTTLKLTVAGLAFITTLKSIQCIALTWIQNILYFTDIEGAGKLSYTKWWQSNSPLMVAGIGLYVQTFFCYRLYVISHSYYVVLPIATLLLFAFSSIIVETTYIPTTDDHKIALWFACHLGTVFVGDISLSLTTAYFLLRTKKHVLPQTAGVITSLIRLTFQTATPAAICAMLNLIFSQIYASDKMVSTAFNQTLPKLYAISMMWTLNARQSIRAAHFGDMVMDGSSPMGLFMRRTTREDIGLGSIQIRTQQEILQHVDIAPFHQSNRDEEEFPGGVCVKYEGTID